MFAGTRRCEFYKPQTLKVECTVASHYGEPEADDFTAAAEWRLGKRQIPGDNIGVPLSSHFISHIS